MLLFFYLSVIATLLSFIFLIYSFVTSDFSLQTVFLNSSTIKPLLFKIAGSWSSHEGSILLWLCLLQIIGCCYVSLIHDKQSKQLAIVILSLIQLLFGSFIYFTSNPFNAFSFAPKQGLGLNPMLQDIALSIHPPILYLGYVSYVVPFTWACITLLSSRLYGNDKNNGSDRKAENDIKLLRTFANIGILFTTIGIALGSWWAYRELGWGGFWFFDPVENISLFPWLSAIALHHTILVTIKTARMQSWTIILSIITFLLVVFSTFLVRSGFITSIHSFAASPERGAYLLTIFIMIALGSLGLMSYRGQATVSSLFIKDFLDTVAKPRYDIKEKGIILGNICFLTSLVILISATLYPVIYSLFDDKPVIINEEFFVNNFIIFVIPILFIAGLFTTNSSRQKHIIILLLSLVICYPISFKVKYGLISATIIVASVFLMLHNINFLLNRTAYFKKALKVTSAAVFLGHFGFALIAFSITINSLLQSEVDFTGLVGESKILGEFKVTLQNIKFSQGENYYRQIAEFWLEDGAGEITILKPENRFYIIEKTLSQESDIYSYLTYDLYAVLSNIDNDIIHAKIYYRPMISFIWLGVIITSSGFLIGLINRRKKSNS
ncbi:heme lyase CcmF/NrfE family subunit [Rickettsia endosymbiont of Halotydeus destructor]|uniref:heme lyase CcmF/NrfE family subunit n=1 Tax=Rickettsia endosymbiont of Halotydeus destructor TaxID=2996754 RepID=UPI003BB0F8E2